MEMVVHEGGGHGADAVARAVVERNDAVATEGSV